MANTIINTTPLLSNDDIEIRIIQPQDHDEVLKFLRLYYYKEEPLTCGSEPKHQDMADEEFNMSNIKYGTCLMAVEQENANIVGVLLSGPKGPDEAEHLYEAAAAEGSTKWGKTLQFLANVERNANVCQRYDVTKVLHAHVFGVNSQVRGTNIGVRLLFELRNLAQALNYELMTADCTSYYSAQLCERLGGDCVNVAYYKDFLDENNRQIFRPPMPHDCCRTFAIRL